MRSTPLSRATLLAAAAIAMSAGTAATIPQPRRGRVRPEPAIWPMRGLPKQRVLVPTTPADHERLAAAEAKRERRAARNLRNRGAA